MNKVYSNQQAVRVIFESYDKKILSNSVKNVLLAAVSAGANVVGPFPLPTKRTLITVQSSPFIYKKHRHQYEMRVHKRLLDIVGCSPTMIAGFGKLPIPASVGVTVKVL